MKKLTFRKQLAILLAIAFIFSLLPVSALAVVTPEIVTVSVEVDYDSWGTHDAGGAVVTLSGPGGTFSVTTGSNGKGNINNVPVGSYSYTVTYNNTDWWGNTTHYRKTGTINVSTSNKSLYVKLTDNDKITANLDHIDIYHKGYLTIITKINGVPQGSGVTKNVDITNVSATLVDSALGINQTYTNFTDRSQTGTGEQEYHTSTVNFSTQATITIHATMTIDGQSRTVTSVISGASLAAAIAECPAHSGADIRLTDQEIINTFTHNVTFVALDGGTLQSGLTTNDTITVSGISAGAAFPGTPTPVPDPTYEFVGWYADQACTTPAVFPATVTADTTWYAKFQVAHVPVYQYKIIEHYTLIVNGVAQTPAVVPGSVQTAPGAGTASISAGTTTTYGGLTYTYDGSAANVLNATLVDGQVVELHRYWTRTADYSYKIIDHYTLTINGSAQPEETVDSGVIAAPAGGTATCPTPATMTYEGVTYNYNNAAANVTSLALVDGQTVVLHRYWTRTAEYAYKIIDTYTLTINGAAQTPETVESSVTTTGVSGTVTCPVPVTTSYESVPYNYDDTAANVTSIALVDGQTVVLYRYWVRTAEYKYQINRYYTTSGVTTDVPGSVVATGNPASITVDPSDYNPYDGKTYAFNAGASRSLTINLVDGDTIVVNLYYTRDAQYTYQIVRHYTTYVDGVFSSYTSKTDGVIAASTNASVSADPALYTSYNGVTYTLTGVVGNPTGTLVDGVTAVIELYYSYNDIPLNPPEEPDDDDDDIPLDTAGDPNDLVVFLSIGGAALAAIAALVVIDIKKNKHNV
jgi:hypothetical protein